MKNGGGERAVAFVVARLGSSRFPAKQFRKVGGKTILERIFDALSQCRKLDEAVLATVAGPENEPLRVFAEERKIPLFWYEGDPDHVTTRLRLAAEAHRAEMCLLVSADCPLVHAPSIDLLIEAARLDPQADYVMPTPKIGGKSCLMEGVQAARLSAWQRGDDLSDKPELKEHQFPVIYRNPDLFRGKWVNLDPAVYGDRHHRMSVDTWADLEFMETLHTRLTAAGKPFALPEAVELMAREPGLLKINGHVHQRQLVEDIREPLFIADAGGPFGYGHFMRCRELAGQLTERLSWPVTFLLDDERAARMALDSGFKVLWGAVGRETRENTLGLPGFSRKAWGVSVVDVSAQRALARGWRAEYLPLGPVAVIDREDETAQASDLIIFPGVTGRRPLKRPASPKILEGLEFAILRREVRRYAPLSSAKEFDVLAYLYPEGQKEAVRRAAGERGWKVKLLEGFSEDFPYLLAKSKVFVSGYGNAFYEALHVNAIPVAWPLSELHKSDALAFYEAAGLPDLTIGEDTLGETLSKLLNGPPLAHKSIEDGTPRIVEALKNLALGYAP